jgi:hypothetical protein
MIRQLFCVALAVSALLGAAGCSSCHKCKGSAPAVSSAPPCDSCGAGAIPAPPPPSVAPLPAAGQNVYYQ